MCLKESVFLLRFSCDRVSLSDFFPPLTCYSWPNCKSTGRRGVNFADASWTNNVHGTNFSFLFHLHPNDTLCDYIGREICFFFSGHKVITFSTIFWLRSTNNDAVWKTYHVRQTREGNTISLVQWSQDSPSAGTANLRIVENASSSPLACNILLFNQKETKPC